MTRQLARRFEVSADRRRPLSAGALFLPIACDVTVVGVGIACGALAAPGETRLHRREMRVSAMKRRGGVVWSQGSRWAALALVSSCALPKFGTVDSFDDGASGSAGQANTSGSAASGATGKAGAGVSAGNGGTSGSVAQGGTGEASAGEGPGGTGGASATGGSDACTTPPRVDQCPMGCVDLTSDPLHCGACNEPCGPSEVCDQSQCICAPDTLKCSGVCVPHTAEHCGTCTTVCPGVADCTTNQTCKVCAGGCAVLTMTEDTPFYAYFRIDFDPPVDLGTTIRIRLHGPVDANMEAYFTNQADQGFGASKQFKATPSWQDWDIPVNNQLDFKQTTLIRFALGRGAVSPTSVYIESISSDSATFPKLEFATDASPLEYSAADSTGPGTLTWVKN